MSTTPELSIPGAKVTRTGDSPTITAADGYVCTFTYDAEHAIWRPESPWTVPAPVKPFANEEQEEQSA